MILVAFETIFNGIIYYKNVDDVEWNELNIDIETLNLLISNFGIKSSVLGKSIEYPSTGQEITMKYHGADISLHCGCNVPFDISILE
jgi:hypothetical protein